MQSVATSVRRPNVVEALVVALRPRQWTKNVLVAAAPLAAGRLTDSQILMDTAMAVVCFCAAASAVYLFNDVQDVEADRAHPLKQARPIAAGWLSARAALVCAGVLATWSLSLGFLVHRDLGIVLGAYLFLQVAYAISLKHEPVLDIAIVASGFLLRAVAGGLATDLPLSQWFLLVASFGSLFMVAGKRYSELKTIGSEALTRKSLVRYTESYLRFVWSIAAGVTITAYSLWAFNEGPETGISWQAISIAPFVLGLLRYAVDIDAGKAGEPEDIVLRDRLLQVIGVLWLGCICLGVFGA
jgi:decaprenyl-phosphate phosphoribosyltransferase